MDLSQQISAVDWTVVEELHHIPHGRKSSLQEALRVEYAAYRKLHRQLGASLPPSAALQQAVHNLRRAFPDFEPRYDRAFFFEGSRTGRSLAGDPLAAEIHNQAANGGGASRRYAHHPAHVADQVLTPAVANGHR